MQTSDGKKNFITKIQATRKFNENIFNFQKWPLRGVVAMWSDKLRSDDIKFSMKLKGVEPHGKWEAATVYIKKLYFFEHFSLRIYVFEYEKQFYQYKFS